MTISTGPISHSVPRDATVEFQRQGRGSLSIRRLNVMRVGYLFMVVGLALVKWPLIIQGTVASLPAYEGVVAVLLTAMSLLALVGLRYPVRMLPILVFESTWKLIWLAVVAIPNAAAGELSDVKVSLLFSISFVAIILVVTPWDYVWKNYVTAPGDRWR